MIGLLLKDLIYLKRQAKILLAYFALYAILFIMMDNASFLYGMIIILSTTLAMNTFAYDEAAKWDNYVLSLPITKQQIVLCKYLLSLIFAFAGILICILISFIKNKMNLDTWITIYALSGISILITSLMLPFLYKFGTQKSRLLIVCATLVPIFAFILLSELGLSIPSKSTILLLLKLSPLVLFACVIGSYFISCNIFEKKEL